MTPVRRVFLHVPSISTHKPAQKAVVDYRKPLLVPVISPSSAALFYCYFCIFDCYKSCMQFIRVSYDHGWLCFSKSMKANDYRSSALLNELETFFMRQRHATTEV